VIVKLLLEHGADTNAKSEVRLHLHTHVLVTVKIYFVIE